MSNGGRHQRARYGRLHIYNNYYRIGNPNYAYTWGVGVESAIVAQNNYFDVRTGVAPARFIRAFRSSSRPDGTIQVSGTYVNGILPSSRVDVLAAYNQANEPDLSSDVGWVPVLADEVNGTAMVATVVPLRAGPMKW